MTQYRNHRGEAAAESGICVPTPTAKIESPADMAKDVQAFAGFNFESSGGRVLSSSVLVG